MKPRARISFPVIEDVGKWTLDATGRAILLAKVNINPAVIDARYPAPSHCRVQGVLLFNGRPIELIIPIVEWERLKANPVHFTEDETVTSAPFGAVLDYRGRIANRAPLVKERL